MTEVEGYPRKRINLGDVTLNILDIGEGKPVLLIHGYPDCHTVWRNQIPMLVEAGYRVIAPDTRGRGESDMPEGPAHYKVSILVEDMVALLDALGIEKVQLIGHDWGAMIGWHMAIAFPKRIEQYVALSVGHPNAYARGGLMQKLKGWYIVTIQLRGFAEFSIRAWNWWLLRRVSNFPGEAQEWIRLLEPPGRLTAALNYYRANFGSLAFAPKFPNVTIPVIGVFSDGDRYLTERQMKRSARYCDAGFEYFRLNGVNHWLQLDAPEQLNELLRKKLT